MSGIRAAGARTVIERAGCALASILAVFAWHAQPARSSEAATTSASIAPSLSPDRLGANAALTFTIDYSGGVFGVPAPVRGTVLRFPAGFTLDVPTLSSCGAARLRARGPGGCPAKSELGTGRAIVETHTGTENVAEEATLWAFLGPPHNLNPTVEIFAHSYTPLDEQALLAAEVTHANDPYGEQMTMSIPPIPTLMLEPDASVVSFSLTIGRGADARRRGHANDSVLIPARCPTGGFPFAAEFTYADGSTGAAQALTPCPR